jgi:Type III flagellar switch regulator (C-ring) FliN C-term
VTKRVFEWLPLSSCGDARVMAKIGEAVEQWSARWFVHGQYRASKPVLRMRGYRTAQTDIIWMACDDSVAVAWSTDGGLSIARQSLDATKAKMDMQIADKALLATYAKATGCDLIETLMKALNLPFASNAEITPISDPFLGSGGIEIDFDRDFTMAQLRVAIPAAMIAPLRKTFIGSPIRPTSDAMPMTDALAAESLVFTAALGAARLPISEVRALGVGDILVLDTRLTDAIPFCSEKSQRTIGNAVVSQGDGRVRLVVSAVQGARNEK